MYVVKKTIFKNKNLTLKPDEKTFYIQYKFTSNFYTILKTTKFPTNLFWIMHPTT